MKEIGFQKAKVDDCKIVDDMYVVDDFGGDLDGNGNN